MYRIQLESRNEAIYRSLQELAVGVQNGIVTADALIYHVKTGTWLPIEAHPHFHVARRMVLPHTLRMAAESRQAAARGRVPEAEDSVRQKRRHEVSPREPGRTTDSRRHPGSSGRPVKPRTRLPGIIELHLGRYRPSSSWLMAAAVSGLAAIGWLYYGPEEARTGASVVSAAGMDPPSSITLPPAEDLTSESMASAAESGLTYEAAYQAARDRFEEGMATVEFANLFAPSRLGSADGLRNVRRTVAGARNIVAVYRGEEIRIDRAYELPYVTEREPAGVARSVDSLFAAIDSLHGLLLDADGRYRFRGGRIAFEDPWLTSAYLGQAIWLETRLRDWGRHPDKTPLTIKPIITAVGRIPRSQTGN